VRVRLLLHLLLPLTACPWAVAQTPPFHADALQPVRDSFEVVAQGIVLGYSTSRLEREGTGWRLSQRALIAGLVDLTTEVRSDDRFHPLSVRQEGTVQGERTTIAVSFVDDGRRVEGTAVTTSDTGEVRATIDATAGPDVLDENQLQAILGLLPWAPEAEWRFALFSAAAGEINQMVLRVVARVQVDVAGTIREAYQAELTGSGQPATFYVTAAPPHRIVRVALPGTPIELIRVGDPDGP